MSLEAKLVVKIPAMWMASRTDNALANYERKFAPKPKLLAGLCWPISSFFHDRFAVHLKGERARHDAIDAVLPRREADNLLLVARRWRH